ncbi:hypothetical protein [Sulfuracidifex metallicus]|uniref:hypothetical protein n=1 Tax=Sulfuracidifex metallicus TaxID=47303 RepID=UPI0022746CEC|nr:hypothetical protein [Sulfuracidifex metallicus]MCY0851005.1 hypothetical protein [Sulfuracidifex metallicus]
MEYRYYPVTLILSTGLVDSILLMLGIADFRILVVSNTIVAVLVEMIHFPFPKRTNIIVNLISLFWIFLVIYYMIGILGGV